MEENKFNFSEEDKEKDLAIEQSKQEIKADAKGLWKNTKRFLVELLDFRNDTDRDATIEAIKGDISFKGATAWILICSIFVASVGLNANSTAVVIGAMLISPLMGPILGVGLSIAVNDIDTLKKSLINLATMIVLSLLTAFLFFWLFPLNEDTSELLGRTEPDIRDVLIAFFGGLALIIARTKRGTIASVIFGVAIATALMPPLCTVGYGLAVALQDDPEKGLRFAYGAMYLFTINTIFIALATFLVLKLLRFPMLKYANSAKRKRIARIASLLAVAAMVPAGFAFYNVLKRSNFEIAAKRFVEKELSDLNIPNLAFVKRSAEYHYAQDEKDSSYIQLFLIGPDIDNATIKRDIYKSINSKDKYKALKDVVIVLPDNKDENYNELKYLKELREIESKERLTNQQKINDLEQEVGKLKYLEQNTIPIDRIKSILRTYKSIDSFSFVMDIRSNFKADDTLKVFNIKWNDTLTTPDERLKSREQLEALLLEQFKPMKLKVRNIN